MPLLHSRHVDHCSGRLLAIFVRLRQGEVMTVPGWYEVMEDSSSYADYFSALVVKFIYVPIALLPVIIYSVIVIKLKTH